MRFLKRNRPVVITVVGGAVMTGSIAFEYARMAPDYRYIIEPWSVRGYDTTQGTVMAVIGVAIIVVAVLLGFERLSASFLSSLAITGAVTLFAVVLATLTSPPDVALSWPAVWGLAVVTGFAVHSVAGRLLPADLPRRIRRTAILLILAGTIVVSGLALYTPIFSGNEMPLWVVVLVAFVAMDLLVLAGRPYELAVYRLLINGVVMGWLFALSMSGALRTTLRRLQEEAGGVGADYRDIQITSGVMIAWLGGLVAFVGAVALWARRREQLEAHQRAQRQLDAARQSAEELGEDLGVTAHI